MYFKALFYLLLMFSLVSCSVKFQELDAVSRYDNACIVISVLTDVPHANYEVKQIKKELSEMYLSNPELRNLQVCMSSDPEAKHCKTMFKDYHAHTTMTIKELAGIGDAGNVFSDRVEGKGHAKALVVVKNKDNKIVKEYVLESSAKSNDTELARGVGDAVRNIAKKAANLVLDDLNSLSEAEKNKI